MKSLYESILSSTNVGKAPLVRAWLEEHDIKNYTINTRGEIDIDGDVDLSYKNIKEFPYFIQFGTIKGNFDCKHNNLTSLKGVPREVKETFDCSCNDLTSLEGAPEKVGRSFDCAHNYITSLEGAPDKIKGYFDCGCNEIKDLKGAPKVVGGYFDCGDNNLTSLKGSPKVVGGNFICRNNTARFSEEDVNKVCKVESKSIWV